MNQPRRVRSPPFGYDSRLMGRLEGGGGRPLPPSQLDYDEPPIYHQRIPYEFQHHQQQQNEPIAFIEQQQQQPQYPINFRVHHPHPHNLPTYRPREQHQSYATAGPGQQQPHHLAPSVPYKILCITNINHKVNDNHVKEALINEFSRFGDISVSICHDSGERLAYIYFRSYEEAREARHVKLRSLLFDRPIEIEPIFEPSNGSPQDSPTQQQLQHPSAHQFPPSSRLRRSLTPPEYHNGPPILPPQSRRAPPPPPSAYNRGHPSQPPHYNPPSHLASRYPPHQGPPMPYNDRYYPPQPPPQHIPPTPQSPYSSPPHFPTDPYRSYHPHGSPQHKPLSPPPPQHNHHNFQPYGPYGPPVGRDRERYINETQARSPRQDPYNPVNIHRMAGGYPVHPQQQPTPPSRRHQQSIHQAPAPYQQHQSSGRRLSPVMFTPQQQQQNSTKKYMSRDFRREKYGPENSNMEPEEGRPSRVLFVTNISPVKDENEIREIFSPFGIIEEMELKKVSSEISSVLIKFTSMDCAYKAKTATNGKYLGNIKCRIAYGKVSASRRLWIGGLGTTTTVALLRDEFSKFGNIVNLDYVSGRPYAYVEFETANQAQFATHHLIGTMAIEAERKLRIEYVDPVDRIDKLTTSKNDQSINSNLSQDTSTRSRSTNDESWATNDTPDACSGSPQSNNHKRSITPTEINPKRLQQVSQIHDDNRIAGDYIEATPATPGCEQQQQQQQQQHVLHDENNDKRLNNDHEKFSSETVENNHSLNEKAAGSVIKFNQDQEEPNPELLLNSTSIKNIVDGCPTSWVGHLVLRNFTFPSKMSLCYGRKATIEKYITKLNNEFVDQQCPILRITQRWRLHPQPKLEDVKRRMQTGNLGIMIITAKPEQSPSLSSPLCKTPQTPKQQSGDKNEVNLDEKTTESSTDTSTTTSSASQLRPLKNLISYLEQKDAAGVISLNAIDGDQTDGSKLLYAFPPGDFALNLLKSKAPNLSKETAKEEFLLGVIVGGADAKI